MHWLNKESQAKGDCGNSSIVLLGFSIARLLNSGVTLTRSSFVNRHRQTHVTTVAFIACNLFRLFTWFCTPKHTASTFTVIPSGSFGVHICTRHSLNRTSKPDFRSPLISATVVRSRNAITPDRPKLHLVRVPGPFRFCCIAPGQCCRFRAGAEATLLLQRHLY